MGRDKYYHIRLWGTVLFVMCLAPRASEASKTDALKERYADLVVTKTASEVAGEALLLTAEQLDAFGEVLAVRADKARAVLDVLAEDGSARAATLRAELLVWRARPHRDDMRTQEQVIIRVMEVE